MRFLAAVALAVLSISAACVPRHRAVVPGARLSVGAESFVDDGPFRIAFAGPKGETASPREITIAFSRAMHPLAMLDDQAARVPAPAAVARAHDGSVVDGTWRWFSERTAVFWPTEGFATATEYRVTIPAGTRALDGSTLGDAPTFSFTSARPSLRSATYAFDESAERHIVTIDFDQPIRPSEVRRAIRIEGRGAKGVSSVFYRVLDAEPQTQFELDVDRRIASLDDATVIADRSLLGTQGPLASDRDVRLRLAQVGPLRAEISCNEVDRDRPTPAAPTPRRLTRCPASNGGDVTLELSKAVSTKELARHLGVSPPTALKIDESTAGATTSRLYLSSLMEFAPGRTYRFTLGAGLRSVDKEKLAANEVLDVQIGDLDPALTWRDMGKVAVVESARPAVSLAMFGTNVPAFDTVRAPIDDQQLFDVLLGSTTTTAQVRALAGSAAVRVKVNAAKNVWGETAFDLPAAMRGAGKTGTFAVATGASGLADDVRVLEVTDLGITADWSPHGGLVWVTHLSSGAPVPGARVALHRAWRRSKDAPAAHVVTSEVYTTRTDQDGVATIPSQVAATFLDDEQEQRAAMLVVSDGDDRAHARLPALDPHLAHAIGVVFTDRRLYRPGESAFVKATFRAPTPHGLVSLVGRPTSIEGVDEEDRVVFATTATLDAFGSCSAEVGIPRTTKLGFVQVRARIGTAPIRPGQGAGGRHRWQWDEAAWPARASFVVDEFRSVDFKVEVASDRAAYQRGDTARVTTHGSYLIGSPMHDVAVPIRLTRTATSFTPRGLEGFATDARTLLPRSQPLVNDALLLTAEPMLGADGSVMLPVGLALPDQAGPESIRVDASIADVSGAFEAGDSATFTVHPGDLYLGVRPSSSAGPIFPGRKVRVELLAAEIDGTRRPDVRVRVDVLRSEGESAAVATGGGCDLVTKDVLVMCEIAVGSPGFYYLRATAVDAHGRPITAAASFFVESSAPPPVVTPSSAKLAPPAPPPPPPPPQRSFDELCRSPRPKGEWRTLSIDTEYDPRGHPLEVGSKAHLCLRGTGSTLLTVEREGVLHHELRHLDPIGTLIDLPITADFHPNVRIALHSVDGRSAPFPDPKHPRNDGGHPASSSASLDLTVDAPLTKLAVGIEMDREARPGAEIVAHVRVHDGANRPASAQVTLWAVDEGVVLLESFKVPDLHEVFAYERGDDVVSLDTRDLLFWEHIGLHHTKEANFRSGQASRGSRTHVARALFRPTAFFFPNLITGPDGVATVKAKLPDNLTTWNVYAVAMTTGEGFGAAESFFRTNKPLMARPQLPRFLRAGDHVDATVMIDSMSKQPLDVKASMRVAGDLVASEALRETTIALPAEGHVPVRFPLDARTAGHGTVTFRVEAPRAKLVDEVTIDQEISAASVLETVVISGETKTRLDEPLGDLARARTDVGGLDFRLAASPLVGLAASLEGLVEYPYGCTEQLTSRLVPLVRLRSMARELGVPLPRDVDGSVRDSIASLLSHQRSDGGFGFWPASKVSEAWLTIAALQALQASRGAGYVVPAEPVDRATAYLVNAKDLDAASRALLEDLFAGEGRPREKELRALAALGDADGMPLFGRALVAHALAKVDRPLALRVLGEVASHARVTGATATVGDEAATSARSRTTLSSDERTTAMVLRAFVAVDPDDALVTKLVRGLLGLRRDGRWATTQANAWALIALDEARSLHAGAVGSGTSGASRARLLLDGDEIAKASFANAHADAVTGTVPMARLVAASGGSLSFTSEGGPLFFEGTLRYARREPPKTPLEHGIHVAKTMRVLKRNAAAVVTTDFRVGDYVEVDVLLASPVARDLVVLDDPLPAGFEAVNQTYANRDAAMIRADVSHAVTHRELRDDRVVTFFDVLPSGEHHTSYVLRVTSGGRFVTPPAKAECMYAPDVFGRTAASVIDARP
jgi:uncharacterized protein YfaS (alpha-2-macroglobulin family)